VPISAYLTGIRAKVGHRLLALPGVAAIIRDPEGRVLLQQRSDDGKWDLPGGAIDPGEPPALTLVREVREETGLIVRPVRLAGVFGGTSLFRMVYPNQDEVEYTDLVFDCAAIGGQLNVDEDETLALQYFAPADIPLTNSLLNRYPPELFAWPPIRLEAWFE